MPHPCVHFSKIAVITQKMTEYVYSKLVIQEAQLKQGLADRMAKTAVSVAI